MKKRMIEVSIFRHFDQNRKTILETDSFNYVNDDILSQYDDEETLHSMIYYSKNLSLAECNYEIYDKKLLAIIHVFKHVKCAEYKSSLTSTSKLCIVQVNKTSKSMHWLAESIQFLEASRINDIAISELQFLRWIEWKLLI